MFIRRSVKRNKIQRAVFITLTVLISIGLVIPLVSIFGNKPADKSAGNPSQAKQTLQERLSDLEAGARENPNDVASLSDLAQLYVYSGKPDQAVATYEKVLKADPQNIQTRVKIANIYYETNKFDLAVGQLQEVLKLDPENKEAHYLYGYVLGVGKKDLAGGVQELQKYVDIAKEGIDVIKAKQTIEAWKADLAKK
ncbi:MAG: tetratricopeptide repeat protein [Firmicutes bacterium]|nr:tetratricopeptide repeat protein [Bacillota bacterium]